MQNQPSNSSATGANKTTNYFNNYFTPVTALSPNVNDAILSYFEEQTGNKESARLLVQAVIDTATAQREDPMTVLAQFQKLTAAELTPFLALYLNVSRVNTSYLGVKNKAPSNEFVTRTIIL